MPHEPESPLPIFPRPRVVHRRAGEFLLRRAGTIPHGRVRIKRVRHPRGGEWFSIHIRPDALTILVGGEAGKRYAAGVIRQFLASARGSIPAMDIEDWPDFPVRGVMLDISRDKVPTMATLRRVVDRFAGWRINQLQLYTEHTFAYAGHEEVWRGASPMTASQIRSLDTYCRRAGIELVPNQNSFGHMERWLKHPRYAPLAETAGPWKTPFGTIRDRPTTLCPIDPGSLRLMADVYAQLLPNFSSGLFNVGCDETFELGQGRSCDACRRRGIGRVYLDYLLKLHRLIRRSGRQMMFWADILLQHPRLVRSLPKNVIALIWGYEAEHPFEKQCSALAASGRAFYVCPGTSSWCSFSGRTTNALANIRRAAESGLRHGASGLLITDWGDYGHRQYLSAAYGPLMYAAAVGWCVAANRNIDIAAEVSRRVFDDASGETGRLWCEAGDVHEESGIRRHNKTVLFEVMHTPLGKITRLPGLTLERVKRIRGRVSTLERRAKRLRPIGSESRLARDELLATLAILDHACCRATVALSPRTSRSKWRALADDMQAIMARHRKLWLARNRPGGLASTVAYYVRNRLEYDAKMRPLIPAKRARRPAAAPG